MGEKVLLIEGHATQHDSPQRHLEQAGFTVRTLNSSAALREAHLIGPSLILIDARPQDRASIELCRLLRKHLSLGRIPLVLLAGASEEDRIRGLEAGADDCLAEPVSARELVARVQSVLRRSPRPKSGPVGGPADIVIDRAAMRLSVRGNEIPTTTLEFRFLDYLALHRGRVFTRDLLLDAVWGEMQFLTPRAVDTCVRRVRNKIEPDRANPVFLKTVRGVGYRFDANVIWPEGGSSRD